MPDFVHLHLHTHYSLLDGMCRLVHPGKNPPPPEKRDTVFGKALRCGMPALAVTDHGNLFGAIAFYREAKACGVKPIIGYEAYVAPGSRLEKTGGASDSSHHLTLLCQDERGYHNLMALASTAYLDGHHFKPRIDKEVLAEHSEGLIALSGCLSSEAATAASKGDTDRARGVIEGSLDVFGRDRFYVEVQENGLEAQARANAGLVGLARELDLKLVATNDVHYLERDDATAHDVLLCIGTGKRRSDPNRLRFDSDAYYFRTPEEMAELFSEIPESLGNTLEVAEKCNLEMEFGKYRYPRFDVPAGETAQSHLQRLVEKGARERYGEITPRVRERMEAELGVIERMGFPGYMLIVDDIVRFARGKGIPVGPGRGSAVGSLVCYSLGITRLDPFKYDLLFERFINEGRNEMPDIDLDFCKSRREEVIDYVTAKYGRDQVVQIVTFSTMAAKASIRDVGRVLDVPLPVVDSFAKLVPTAPNMTFERAFEEEREIRRRAEEDSVLGEILTIARRIEGLVRQPGKHPAGVVIADRPVGEYCPLYRQPGTEEVKTQFDMGAVTQIGLLKIDLLGLQTLTMAHLAADLIEERTGARIELDEVPLDDEETYRLFQRGETKGVFQFESGGMRLLLQRARPDRFEELIALNAMYRPGPMDNIDSFVERKFRREAIESVHPDMDSLLAETYGIMAYQEQVMRITQAVAGFSLSEADKLRKAMGKKKPEIMAQYREKFVTGATAQGSDGKLAAGIYDHIERFAGYGFNKSHSAAYAFLAFQTAYLKTHHPTEFMAALLTLEIGDSDKVAEYADEARRMEIDILPPDVNESGKGFTIISSVAGERTIRFGLVAVKGVGEKAVESVIEARGKGGRFRSLLDFCERVDVRLVNKTTVECLVKAGAFDSLGVGRARLHVSIPRALETGARAQADRAAGQCSLLEAFGSDAGSPGVGEGPREERSPDEGLAEVPEWSERDRLANERKVLGIYVSGHPLSRYERWLRLYTNTDTRSLEGIDGADIALGGLVTSVQHRRSRKRGTPWALVRVEDLVGWAEVRVFQRTLERCGDLLAADRVLFFLGRVDGTGSSPTILVSDIIPYEDAPGRLIGSVVISARSDELDEGLVDDLVTVLSGNRGLAQVVFRVERNGSPAVVVRAGDDLKAAPGVQLESDLAAVLGEGRLRIEPAPERFRSTEPPRRDFRRDRRSGRGRRR